MFGVTALQEHPTLSELPLSDPCCHSQMEGIDQYVQEQHKNIFPLDI